MAYENIEKKLFGVQFHPESYLSEVGNIIVKNFIKFCRS
jgi:anthranilate/para-aminobenzoate synthase component II